MNSTDKQVGFAMALLAKAGYDTRHMGSRHKALGATMKERSGSVEQWLRGMDRGRISQLIDALNGGGK